MATPFSIQGTLVYPPDSGQPAATRAFSNSGAFSSKQESDLVLTGSGTKVVSFGTVAAAKGLLVELDATALAPVNLLINSSVTPIELAPGGFLAISSPAPTAGITALSVVYTLDATLSIRILG